MSWKKRYEKGKVIRFDRGKYYMYSGSLRRPQWNSQGRMDFVLDNKPHLCTKGGLVSVSFENNCSWDWRDGLENWVEC